MACSESGLSDLDSPKENKPCVTSRFLFTERDFREYFVPAQIWLDEWDFKLTPIGIVVGLPISAIMGWILIALWEQQRKTL